MTKKKAGPSELTDWRKGGLNWADIAKLGNYKSGKQVRDIVLNYLYKEIYGGKI